MKRISILVMLFLALSISCSAHAKCLLALVQVHGNVVGQIQEGDEILFRFIYSKERVETSSPQLLTDRAFSLEGAFSTFKRRGVFQADVCGATPRQLQLLLRDKTGSVLDIVSLTTPDERRGSELSFGTKQIVALHRTRSSQPQP
jgi:hypothetical protein